MTDQHGYCIQSILLSTYFSVIFFKDLNVKGSTQAMCLGHWSPDNSTTPGHCGSSGAALSNRNDSPGLSLEVLLPA